MRSTLQGYNAAIIAYGQTGTGKTYTMEGSMSGGAAVGASIVNGGGANGGGLGSGLEGEGRGVIPRAIEDIFAAIQNDPEPSSR